MNYTRLTGGAALTALMLFGGTAAYAADLGGNCCADLEERVAELEATTARKGNRKVSLEVSGHVNEALLYYSGVDALRAKLSVVPATNSQSRFRFKGKAKIDANWEAGFLIEVGIGSFSDGIDEDVPGATERGLGVRHSALYVKSKTLGSVWLGRTSTATDGIAEICLCGGASNAFTQMSIDPTLGALGAPGAISDVLLEYDGGRADVIKYQTPSIGGFVISASWGGSDVGNAADLDGSWDAALRYAGEFGAIRVAAGVGYSDSNRFDSDLSTTIESKRLSGSASIQHTTSGLFLSVAGARVEGDFGGINDAYETRAYWIKAGVAAKTSALGTSTFYGEFGDISSIKILGVSIDGEHQVYGIGFNQSFDAAAMDWYIGYRKHKLDGLGADDIDVIITGFKIQF